MPKDNAYFASIGRFISAWALAETALNLNVAALFLLHRAIKLEKHPPRSFDRKISLFKKVHKQNLPTLADSADDIAERLIKLHNARAFLIHGIGHKISTTKYKFTLMEFTGISPRFRSMQRYMTFSEKDIEERTAKAYNLSIELINLLKSAFTLSNQESAVESGRELAREFLGRFPRRDLRSNKINKRRV